MPHRKEEAPVERRRRPVKRIKRRGRTRGRFGFLYKFLSIILICAALIAGLTLFFKTAEIRVEGVGRYAPEEISSASGIKIGDNLILLNKYAVANRIFSALPYVDKVVIRRDLPGTLVISVTECSVAAAAQGGGYFFLIDKNGKLLERCDASLAARYPQVLGVELAHPSVGEKLEFESGAEAKKEYLLEILAALHEKEMLGNVQSIDLAEQTVLRLWYLERFTVLIPLESDYPFKLKYLDHVVKMLASNEKGTIDLTREEAHFIPNR